jgi:hypothetical protein
MGQQEVCSSSNFFECKFIVYLVAPSTYLQILSEHAEIETDAFQTPKKAEAHFTCKVKSSYFSISIANGFVQDSASPDDPNELSFVKNEVLDIIDAEGKWWLARKADGTTGSMFQF